MRQYPKVDHAISVLAECNLVNFFSSLQEKKMKFAVNLALILFLNIFVGFLYYFFLENNL